MIFRYNSSQILKIDFIFRHLNAITTFITNTKAFVSYKSNEIQENTDRLLI